MRASNRAGAGLAGDARGTAWPPGALGCTFLPEP